MRYVGEFGKFVTVYPQSPGFVCANLCQLWFENEDFSLLLKEMADWYAMNVEKHDDGNVILESMQYSTGVMYAHRIELFITDPGNTREHWDLTPVFAADGGRLPNP